MKISGDPPSVRHSKFWSTQPTWAFSRMARICGNSSSTRRKRLASLAWTSKTVRDAESREIAVTGEDVESLLYAWLAEILAIAEASVLFFAASKFRTLAIAR